MPIKLAIVGRPNVGKSTLFNRLAGRRAAIVDDMPGVTRDRKHARGRLGDLDFDLIDTAGFEDVSDLSLEARMRAQTEAAIAEADVIVFMIDARAGVTPADERFAQLLRRADKPIVLAANKCEGKAGEAGLMEAYALGLGEPIGLSAEEGDGLSDIYAAIVAATAAPPSEPAEKPEAAPIKLAVIGRPNAGKSTLINALLGQDRLLTGPEAGITRDAIAIDWSWRGRAYQLVDTAGMRRKARVEGKLEKLSVADTIHAIRFSDVCALVMDQKEAFEKQDLAIADLVVREGRALIYVLAKWDQAGEPAARYAELKDEAAHAIPEARHAPLVRVAALSGQGLNDLMNAVSEAYGDWNARVKTADLNAWLRHALERHPPPAVNGKRIKPRYIAQTKSRPPTFVLISSRAGALPDSYRRYLANGIREAFDLGAAPIRLIVRQNKNPYTDDEAD
jgi:GTP-binding protein